jgi:hypothetical protein
MKKLTRTTGVLLCIFVISCSKKDSTPQPSANFSFSDANLVSPAKIAFQNTSTNAITYTWDFGDGQTSTQANPNHVYRVPGTYEVTLTATGSGINEVKKAITIQPPYTVCRINSVIIKALPDSDNGAAWDFDGTTPDVYYRLVDTDGNILFTSPTYYTDPQLLPLQWTLPTPLSITPLTTPLQLQVLDYDSGFSPDVMGAISFAPSIAQLKEDDPYPASWVLTYGEVTIQLGLEWL